MFHYLTDNTTRRIGNSINNIWNTINNSRPINNIKLCTTNNTDFFITLPHPLLHHLVQQFFKVSILWFLPPPR